MMRRPLTSVELSEEDIKEMSNILGERMRRIAKQEDQPAVGVLKVAEPLNRTDNKPRTSSGLSSPFTQITGMPTS